MKNRQRWRYSRDELLETGRAQDIAFGVRCEFLGWGKARLGRQVRVVYIPQAGTEGRDFVRIGLVTSKRDKVVAPNQEQAIRRLRRQTGCLRGNRLSGPLPVEGCQRTGGVAEHPGCTRESGCAVLVSGGLGV